MNCSMLNFSLAFRHSIKTNAFVHLKSRMPMTTKTFASAADLEIKQVSFDKLSEHAYAYTAEGDPNTGVVANDDAGVGVAFGRVGVGVLGGLVEADLLDFEVGGGGKGLAGHGDTAFQSDEFIC